MLGPELGVAATPLVVLDGTNVLAPVAPATGVLAAGGEAAGVVTCGTAGTRPTPWVCVTVWVTPPDATTDWVIVLKTTCGTVTV